MNPPNLIISLIFRRTNEPAEPVCPGGEPVLQFDSELIIDVKKIQIMFAKGNSIAIPVEPQ